MGSPELTKWRVHNKNRELEQWTRQNSKKLREQEIRRRKLEISELISYSKDNQNAERNFEYSFLTRNWERWKVNIARQHKGRYDIFLDSKEISFLDDLTRIFVLKQSMKGTKEISHEERDHIKGVDFLAVNWERISKLLFPLSPHRNGLITPSAFVEVDLGGKENSHEKFGTADLIGIGPDCRISVFEFGKNDKYDENHKYLIDKLEKFSQVKKYERGIRSVLSQREIPIFPFVVTYSFNGANHLQIRSTLDWTY